MNTKIIIYDGSCPLCAACNSQQNSFYLGTVSLFAVQEYNRRMKFINLFQNHPAIIFVNIASAAFIIFLIFQPIKIN